MPAAIFERVALLGTGLIGGSFGLAVRSRFPNARVIGWDRKEILKDAVARGAVETASTELGAALAGADLVYVALPIGVTLDLLPAIARQAAPGALVTDASSTKAAICRTAEKHFTGTTRFLGGHPLAGSELSGIAHARADLFRDAPYALIARADEPDPRVERFAELLRAIGARPVWLDAETHDRSAAVVSHLPQLLAVALAQVAHVSAGGSPAPVDLAGSGLRDMLRLAGSPYEMWRDICLTNSENIAAALDRLAQELDHLRMHLKDRELEKEFSAANRVYQIFRGMK